jgi:hypothetical protein
MAENIGALILPIGADPSQFNRSINDVKTAYKELEKVIASTPFNLVTDKQKLELNALKETLNVLTTDVKEFGQALEIPENSILGLKKRIQELNNEKIRLDPTTSGSKIAKLTQEIEVLEDKLQNVNNLGKTVGDVGGAFSKGADKIVDSSKRARIAVSNLSLVAQDLPFGFIAIQNNLPNLFASLGQLDTKTNGLKGAFKDLGSQLIGPAGAFLAFSIVTAAVTFAVKEYGSLTNAVKVLFGANSAAIKSQNDFNKALLEASGSTGGQIAKINILVATIQNENTTQKERIAAYRELKRVNPDVVAGIDEQNLSTAKSIKLIGENAKAQLEFIKLQTKATGIQKALDGLEQRRFEANGKYNAAREAEKKLISDLQIAEEKRTSGERLSQLQTNNLARKNILLGDAAKAVQKERDEISGITADTDKWYKSLEPTIAALSKISSNAQDLTDNLDKLRDSQKNAGKDTSFKFEIEPLSDILTLQQKISLLEELGTVILDTKSKESERIKALSELSDLESDVFGGIELQNLTYNQLRATLTGLGKTYQNLILQEKERVESLRLVDEAIKRQTYLNKVDREEFVRNYKEKRQEINKTVISIPKQITVPVNFPINKENLEKLKLGAEVGIAFGKEQKDIDDREKKYIDSIKKIGSAVESGLRKPFRDFFDTLIDEGKFTFDSFADFAKDAFKRILAQLAAAGIAKLVTTILTGGVPLPIGSSRIQEPRFEGIGSSPLQIAGAVNLILRGSDLVGSINRTNSTINRVG